MYAKGALAAVAAVLFSAAGHAAPVITFDSAPALDGSVLTTPEAGATVYDFNDGLKPAGYSGDGGIVSGSVGGQYAAPAGDTTNYLSVAIGSASGTEVFLGGDYNYFGLYWGSIDTYNTLAFYNNGSLVVELDGADVIAAGATFGDQIAPGANRYVNIYLGTDVFDEIRFTTTSFAFESDNHAFAKVSEPATLALIGAGLLGFGLARRRRG